MFFDGKYQELNMSMKNAENATSVIGVSGAFPIFQFFCDKD